MQEGLGTSRRLASPPPSPFAPRRGLAPPDGEGPGCAPPGSYGGPDMSTRAPRKLSIAVALLTLAITVGLTVLSWQVTTRSEERLLARQLAQVGTLLGNQSAVLEVTLADVGQVAVNTG